MEEFDFTRRVSPTQAKHDKISFTAKSWILQTVSIAEFRDHLAIPPENLRELEPPHIPATFGWLFSRPSPQNHWHAMNVRRSAVTPFYLRGRPLFNGDLQFSSGERSTGLPSHVDQYRLKCSIDLNPTRYMRHQAARPAHENEGFAFRDLLGTGIRAFDHGEFALDDAEATNWLPLPLLAQLSPAAVNEHLSNYVEKTLQALQSELERARLICSMSGPCAIDSNLHYTLHRVETYWEFHCVDAISRVGQIEGLLKSGTIRSRHTTYFRDLNTETEQNAMCLRFVPRNGVMLRIYAKTHQRIRFEVEHTLQDQQGQEQTFMEQTTVSTSQALLAKLANLREMAAAEVNTCLERLNTVGRLQPYSHSVLNFLFKFSNTIEDEAAGKVIIELLATNKRVVKGNNSPLADTLNKLKAAGILVNDNRVYVATPPYTRAVNLLSIEKLETLRFIHRSRPQSIFVRRVRPQ